MAASTTTAEQREVLLRHAQMVLVNAEESVLEQNDLGDVRRRFERTRVALTPPSEGTA
jgi:uncharacterized protein (DUF1499 family)